MSDVFPSILPDEDEREAFEPVNSQGLTVEEGSAVSEQISNGICPWCDDETDREFENVGSHASSAHPDAWNNYKSE